MKKLLWGFIPMIVCLLLAGCKDDGFGNEHFDKDQAVASIKLGMTLPEAVDVKPMSRATNEQETNIEALALFFYKDGVNRPYVIELGLDDLNLNSTGSSGTEYKYSTTITTEQLAEAGILSNTYTIYAIANWNKTFCTVNLEDLKKLSKKELEDYCVLKSNNELDLTATALLLTGKKEGVNLTPKGGSIEGLHLRRITAKIIFDFSSREGVTFTPQTYELHNYSRSSTLIERNGWTDKNGNDDGQNNDGTHPGSLDYMAAQDENAIVSGRPRPIADNGFYFYMLENVQKTNNQVTEWKDREANSYGETNEGPKTFTNAPENATYVVVKGTYSGPISRDNNQKVTGEVTYTIHLGDFSTSTGDFNNYTVRRNAKYTYNVTVNGVSDIIVEAEQKGLGNPGSEGNLMNIGGNIFNLDAHFETVMLELPTNVLSNDETKFSLLLKSPYGIQTITNDDLNQNTTNLDLKLVDWIKFGKPNSKNRFAIYPGDRTFKSGVLAEEDYNKTNIELVDIFGLMSAIKRYNKNPQVANAQKFFNVQNNKIFVTAYVNEYYYYDDDNHTLDVSEFINADDREMSWAESISESKDGHSTYTTSPIFSITQKSIKTMFDMDGSVQKPFGIETIQEGLISASQNSHNVNEPELNWGWRNQWETLYGYLNNKDEFKWERFVNIANNGHYIDDKYPKRVSEFMQTGYDNYLYECFSRNRDEDGDSLLSVDEMKWFLPAFDELTAFQFGAQDLPQEARLTEQTYYTSTSDVYRILWAQEGAAFGPLGQEPNGERNLRCIRSIGADYYTEASSPVSIAKPEYPENSKSNLVIEMDNIEETSLRQSFQQGGYPAKHLIGDNSNRLPHAFEIARQDLSYQSGWSTKNTFNYNDVNSTIDLCQRYYSEERNGSDRGQWRIPNQQELTLMVRHYRAQNAGKSYLSDYTVARTLYNRNINNNNIKMCLSIVITDDGKQNHKITTSWDQFITGSSTNQEGFSRFKIRCVRDTEHIE